MPTSLFQKSSGLNDCGINKILWLDGGFITGEPVSNMLFFKD